MEDKEKKTLQDINTDPEYAQAIIDTVRDPLIVLDGDLRVVSASRAFYNTFSVTAQATEKQLIYDLGNGQWNIPELRKLLENIIPNNESFNDFKVEHDFQTIGKRIMLLNARRIPKPPKKVKIILLAIEDITASKIVEELHNKIKQLEIFTTAATDRELKMVELKNTIKELESEIIKLRNHL